MLLELMEDDRFLLYHDRLWDGLQDELQYLTRAPDHFWKTIGDAIHVAPDDLKSHVLNATVVSIGYLWMDIWEQLSQPPWKYCLGNISESIEEFKDGPIVSDRTASKMQMMVKLGFEDEVPSLPHRSASPSLFSFLNGTLSTHHGQPHEGNRARFIRRAKGWGKSHHDHP